MKGRLGKVAAEDFIFLCLSPDSKCAFYQAGVGSPWLHTHNLFLPSPNCSESLKYRPSFSPQFKEKLLLSC